MNTALNYRDNNSLSISLRLVRLVLGALLVFILLTEISLTIFWQVFFVVLALYSLLTGVFGRDPVFALFGLTTHQLPDHTLGMIAQLECLSLGLICIVVGVMNRNVDSLVFPILPFLGIYPVLLCAIKHDLLGFLLQSYRNERQGKQ